MILNLTDLSDEPLQGQIARQVRAYILAGDLKPDDSLPSIRSLARDQRVSVITVQRAYEALMKEGLIHSRRGKGFYIAAISPDAKKAISLERLRDDLENPIKAALAEGLSRRDITATVEEILEEEQSSEH